MADLTRRTLLAAPLALAAASVAGTADPGAARASTSATASRTRLARAVDAIVADANPRHLGVSVAVFHGGRLLFDRGYGWADRGRPESFTGEDFFHVTQIDRRLHLPRGRRRPGVDTTYDVGSVSKEFCAGTVLLLQERGRLHVRHRLDRYLPELRHGSRITLLDLLHHESGLADYNDFPSFARAYAAFRASGQRDFGAVLRRLDELPLAFRPGTRYAYSNTNFLLLALVVERVTGRDYGDFLHRNVLAPLGMRATRQGYPVAGTTDVALGYTAAGATVHRSYQWNLPWLQGPGGLTSTARDLGRWDHAVRRPGLFSAASLRTMFTPRLGDYACGWVVQTYAGEPYVWHNGGVGGYHSMNALFPDHDLAVVLLNNGEIDDVPVEACAPRVRDAVLAAYPHL